MTTRDWTIVTGTEAESNFSHIKSLASPKQHDVASQAETYTDRA